MAIFTLSPSLVIICHFFDKPPSLPCHRPNSDKLLFGLGDIESVFWLEFDKKTIFVVLIDENSLAHITFRYRIIKRDAGVPMGIKGYDFYSPVYLDPMIIWTPKAYSN